MSEATPNRVTNLIVERAKAAGFVLESFTVHDLRRTGSTLLNEAGFNGDWIEKCLAHESGHSSRAVYNKVEYAEPRRHMLQEWANMVDAWVAGETYTPALSPLVPTLRASRRQQGEVATAEGYRNRCMSCVSTITRFQATSGIMRLWEKYHVESHRVRRPRRW